MKSLSYLSKAGQTASSKALRTYHEGVTGSLGVGRPHVGYTNMSL